MARAQHSGVRRFSVAVGAFIGLSVAGAAMGQGIGGGDGPGSAARGTVTSSKLERAAVDLKQEMSGGWQVFGLAVLMLGLVVIANIIPTKRGHQD